MTAERKAAGGGTGSSVGHFGLAGPGEQWSRAGWRVHLPAAADRADAADRAGHRADAADHAGHGDPGELARQWGEDTVPGLAAASAARHGDRTAVVIDGASLTHGQLDTGAAAVAGWLARRIGQGDRVLLIKGSGLGFLRCYLGALRAGAVVVLANPAATRAELEHLLDDSGARLAFADPGPAGRLAGLNRAGLSVLGEADLGGVLADGRPLDPRPRPDDPALLGYTSGTTGRPKGAVLTHRELATSIRSAMAAWRWSGDDVLLHALPLFHQHGLGGVHATLIAGSTARVLSKFSAAGLIAAVQEARASVLFGVPTIYRALADAAGGVAAGGAVTGGAVTGGAAALQGLRLAVCGSAPLSPILAERIRELLGRLPVVRYGTTESGLDVSNPLSGARGDTVGLPLPGVLARIWAGSAEAPAGTDGEIQLRGPQVFGGYWRNPRATAAAFTPDGWFCTGDISCIDPASGHLMIRGRTKELIITGGMNVYPREVELVLERHPAVAEAAVAGVPNERWGEQVTAWVVLAPGHRFDEDELVAHARAALSGYKCPKRVLRADSIPRNHLGKIRRGSLAEGYLPDKTDA